MATTNIKNLPKASAIQSSDLVHLSQGGLDKVIQADVLLEGLELGLPNNLTIKDETSTTRSLLGADKQSYITCLNTSTTTLTLFTEESAGWNLGDQIFIRKGAAGDVVITPDSGVVINTNVPLEEDGQVCFLIYKGTDTWDFVGLGGTSSGGSTDVTNITETTTSRSLGLTDHKKCIICTNAAGCAITVPPQASVTWLDNTEIIGVGTLDSITFIEGVGVDILIPDDRVLECTKGSPWALRRLSSNYWVLTGYLVEV